MYCFHTDIYIHGSAKDFMTAMTATPLIDFVEKRHQRVLVLLFCCFVVYSTTRFVLSLALCYFVLGFFSPFSIAITSLGEKRANPSAFRTFVRFALVWF